MPTQPVYVTFVLCTIILFSCNNNKLNTKVDSAIPPSSDTIKLSANDVINLSEYSNDFIENSVQKFIAVANKVSVIIAKKGLKITVDPAALQKEDGSAIDGKIAVRIIELTTSSDLFKSNAATVSNGRLLASGGSYFVGMECNGQKVLLKKNKVMQMEFPVIKHNEMELFYGERDTAYNMNWISAGKNLLPKQEKNDDLQFTDSNQYTIPDKLPDFLFAEGKEAKIYRTLNEPVYYYDTKMTIKRLVDTINKHQTKIYVDTVFMWPKQIAKLLPGQRVDTNFLYFTYGPPKQFILKRCKDQQQEMEKMAAAKVQQDSAIDKWQPKTLAGQIQKYYAPSLIRTLGWINCDRFYRYNEQTEVEVELPITFNKSGVQYFLVFKSFNGLINGKLNAIEGKATKLQNLPVDEPVTLIAFTKYNNQLFQSKQDFVIQKNQAVKLDFKNISTEEMKTIFGKNVKI